MNRKIHRDPRIHQKLRHTMIAVGFMRLSVGLWYGLPLIV